MKKKYPLLFVFSFFVFLSNFSSAQCPAIICPANVTINSDPGNCGAIYSFTPPAGINTCGTTTQSFSYTGSIQLWTVPAGVTSIHIQASGAQGGFNTNSGVPSGLGATMSGDFTVTPGQQLKILVGQQPTASTGNGGGGGTFVTDFSNNPIIVAGGGGGSAGTTDSPDKNGQITTNGGNGAAGGGTGGTAGNGGGIGSSGFQSGAGGGLLTNGFDGWTSGTGGAAFVNGGAGGPTNSPANGGFGGGGSGSSYVVGGGGGGYSGGGSGGNSSAGVGGGGGSFNNGINQVNISGNHTGNGTVDISYTGGAVVTTTLTAGLASGSLFPVGTTTETYTASDTLGNSVNCSFTITVNDIEPPVITCGGNVSSCDAVVNGISAGTVTDNCSGVATISYSLSGATTGSGLNDASGTTFNPGITTVQYTAMDSSGNSSSCLFNVNYNPVVATLNPFSMDTVCLSSSAVALPAGTPSGGIYSGTGVSGNTFDPSVSGVGTFWIYYTSTNFSGCSSTDSTEVTVDICMNSSFTDSNPLIHVFPNPADGIIFIELGKFEKHVSMQITEMNGRVVKQAEFDNAVEITTDISDLSRGIYLLNITVDNKTTKMKLTRK